MTVDTAFITVFIPAYNEEENLVGCVQAVLAEMERVSPLPTSHSPLPTEGRGEVSPLSIAALRDGEGRGGVEVLIVDDASRDATGRLADELAQADSRIRVIHHAQNRGIGGAFVTAVGAARGKWLILIPADLALVPSEIQRYLQAAGEADVVVGLRSDRRDYTLARRFVSWVNIALIRGLFGMQERQFQYISMYRVEVLRAMQIEYWRSAFFLAEVLIKAKRMGKRLVQVEIAYVPREHGQATGVTPRLVWRTMGDMLTFWLRGIVSHPTSAVQTTAPQRSLSSLPTAKNNDGDNSPPLPTSHSSLPNDGKGSGTDHRSGTDHHRGGFFPLSIAALRDGEGRGGVSSRPRYRPPRSCFVTILAVGVLIITAWHLTRFILALTQWRFLNQLVEGQALPLYIAFTGLAWSVAGLVVGWRLWRKMRYKPAVQIFLLLYLIYIWFDQYIVAAYLRSK